MSSDPRGHRQYVKDNHRLRDSLPPYCTACGIYLDYSLPPTHPRSWTTDHVVALADGGELYGERVLMCRRCNTEKENQRRRLPPTPDTDPDRLVVLLCGPPGAGKTTAAHQSGLTVYDRDDTQWNNGPHFTAALRRLGTEAGARAVVIRTAPTSDSRTRTAVRIQATHTYLVTAPRAELAHRIALRGRHDTRATHAALNTWHKRFDNRDAVQPFPGWDSITPQKAFQTTEQW